MRKLPDLNTWLALTLEGHSQHKAARKWYLHETITAGDLLFCRQTEMGFLRLLTQQRIMQACGLNAFSNTEAVEFLAEVIRDEAIGTVSEVAGTRALWIALARTEQASPNTWMDAFLAALAMTHNIELVTFDQGFIQYEKLGLNLVLLKDSKL